MPPKAGPAVPKAAPNAAPVWPPCIAEAPLSSRFRPSPDPYMAPSRAPPSAPAPAPATNLDPMDVPRGAREIAGAARAIGTAVARPNAPRSMAVRVGFKISCAS